MSSAARQELYFGRIMEPEEVIARVEAVTEDEVDEEAGAAARRPSPLALDRWQRRQDFGVGLRSRRGAVA